MLGRTPSLKQLKSEYTQKVKQPEIGETSNQCIIVIDMKSKDISSTLPIILGFNFKKIINSFLLAIIAVYHLWPPVNKLHISVMAEYSESISCTFAPFTLKTFLPYYYIWKGLFAKLSIFD